ncbi:hypothetical protein ACFLUC_01270, partial [Chloroflexota bacterium]
MKIKPNIFWNKYKSSLEPNEEAPLKERVINFLSIVLLIASFLLLTPGKLFHEPNIGLDPSWKISLNLATKYGLTFGTDFLFTYGPLGILVTRSPIILNKLQFAIWDLYLISNIAIFLIYVYKNIKGLASIFLTFCCLYILSIAPLYSMSVDNLLLLIFLFMLFHYLRHGRVLAIINASLICLLTIFIKINSGFVMLIMYTLFVGYIFIFPSNHTRKQVMYISASLFFLIIVASFVLNTSLIDYLIGGFHIANAYNDAMFLRLGSQTGIEYFYFALSIILVLVISIILTLRSIKDDRNYLFIAFLLSLFIFSIFKSGFVRADMHILTFFIFISSGIGLLCLFASPSIRNSLSIALIFSLMVCFYTLNALNFSTSLKPILRVTNRFQSLRLYGIELFDQNYRIAKRYLVEPHILPD